MLDFDTKSLSRPIEIAWCGDDSICLQWRNTGIVMVRQHSTSCTIVRGLCMYVCMYVCIGCAPFIKVGPYGDWLNFPYDVPVHLVAEPDCCRIITCNGCEILQVRAATPFLSLFYCVRVCVCNTNVPIALSARAQLHSLYSQRGFHRASRAASGRHGGFRRRRSQVR